ncbi:MAG: acetyl-CoA C-acyltransferase [Candidatus Eremiobacteraeota bacterium]|nr:acetyl-CoA C-acyltransferase [Candidatus Eremiobacteraeota bacterium]
MGNKPSESRKGTPILSKATKKKSKKSEPKSTEDRVVVVDGVRTPFVKAYTDFQDLTALDLSRIATSELVARTGIDPEEIDEVVMGTVLPSPHAPNLAREVVLSADLPRKIPGFTLGRACASSAQSVISAAEGILKGEYDTAIAGGAESMSNVPVPYSKNVVDSLMALSKARSFPARMKALSGLNLESLLPTPPAIAESSTGKTMGQHCEMMARKNNISRTAQDEFALASHQNAAKAREEGKTKEEVVTVYPPGSFKPVNEDSFVRADTTVEKLGELKPVFDKTYGTLTAGNSSGLTDGAAVVLLMRESKAKELGLKPLAAVTAWSTTALDPDDQLLLGPALCIPEVLEQAGLTLADIDLIDIHEAFAAQVLSVIHSLESEDFARDYLGQDKPVGKVDPEKVNVNGGSIALGHPFGATGARMVIGMARELNRRNVDRAMLALCAAGGMGTALLLERI